MALFITNTLKKVSILNYIFDAAALALIFLIPAISHLLRVPLFLYEPMRIILVIALIHTNKKNAIILAVTMPVVSLIFSGHPVFVKSLIMIVELLTNVLLFFYFKKIIRNSFLVIFLSIVLSKLFYYLIKLIMIKSLLLYSSLVSTPIFYQVLITFLLSAYIYFYTDLLKSKKPVSS